MNVQYQDKKLVVDATNASLNQILREIVQRTGLRVTGGVVDQPVFGRYGPASISSVLSSLLDGTGSNMLLLSVPNGSDQLVLTPRQGGPTPPNPMAAEPLPYSNYAARQGRGEFMGTPPDSSPVPAPATYAPPSQAQQSSVPANAAAMPNTTNSDPSGQSPNGVKTPLEIYQELQQLRQKPTAAPTTPPQ